MLIKITPNDAGNPPGKLGDAELHFGSNDGALDGLKLIGFGIWERRGNGGRNVTFPARSYAVNGERRSFALLRPIVDVAAQERIRDLIVEAYAAYEERATDAPPVLVLPVTEATGIGRLNTPLPETPLTEALSGRNGRGRRKKTA
jgi:hypothetical protein